MITTLLPIENIKNIISEIFFNKQSKITKISDESVLNAFFYGSSRIAQKALKDIALVESNIFPQYATGTDLDNAGSLFSSLTRFTESKSGTYIFVSADSGTVYPQATTRFSGNNGIEFELVEDLTIGSVGYAYALIRSIDTGLQTNIEANTLINVSPEPIGHIGCINEQRATGGRDNESDEDFRNRIKTHPNIRSRNTISYLTESLRLFNEDILKLFNLGFNTEGKLEIAIVTQNGVNLTSNELNQLLEDASDYLSLTDVNRQGESVGVEFKNVTWYEVNGNTGVDFRVQLFEGEDPDEVRKNIQIGMSRYLDVRTWEDGGSVEWDELLSIVKQTSGVKYVPDGYFNPNVDSTVPKKQFPRIKKFIMRDLNGTIISDSQANLSPVFYPFFDE